MSAKTYKTRYGAYKIKFRLQRRERKTLSISVSPDSSIDVVAPNDAAIDKVLEKVRRRASWIRKQLDYFDQFQPRTPERKFVAGETHLYLGRQYKLTVVPHVQQGVKLYRGKLVVQSCKPRQPERTRTLLENWYRERAYLKFPERVKGCQELFPNSDEFAPTGIVIRQLKSRWGSMTPGGRLILNPALIRAPVDTIDYVITHELCHLKHAHHGREFIDLLTRIMPDWQKRKEKLERRLA